jgi:hypothetical protein
MMENLKKENYYIRGFFKPCFFEIQAHERLEHAHVRSSLENTPKIANLFAAVLKAVLAQAPLERGSS